MKKICIPVKFLFPVFISAGCLLCLGAINDKAAPSKVTLKEPTIFTAKIGKGKATIKIPVGSIVQIERIEGGEIWLKHGEATARVPIEKTDYEELIAKMQSQKQNAAIDNKIVENESGKIGSPYIREEPIGTFTDPPKPDYSNPFLAIPINDWTGKQFLFMPLEGYDAQKGYPASTKESGGRIIQDSYIPYDKYKGRSFTVLQVNRELGFGWVQIQMDDTREKLFLEISTDKVKGIALKRDIDYARDNFLGKTLWLKNTEAKGYESTTKKEIRLKLKNLQPVKVIDVVLSDTETWPLNFILQDSEGRIFTKISQLSGTTTEYYLYDSYRFHDMFFLEDPRKKYTWDEEVFTAIEEGKVFPGMTKQQARISWGKPLKINTTTSGTKVFEQWIYPLDVYIYFDDDKLRSIQN